MSKLNNIKLGYTYNGMLSTASLKGIGLEVTAENHDLAIRRLKSEIKQRRKALFKRK